MISLFFPKEQCRPFQAQEAGLGGGAEEQLRGVEEVHFLVAHVQQLLPEGVHVAIAHRGHEIVDGKCSAFFQHPQALQQEGLLILAGDVMVDIITDHRIKSSVRKGQGVGVSWTEKALFTPSAMAFRKHRAWE